MSICHAALHPGARAEPRDDGHAGGFPHGRQPAGEVGAEARRRRHRGRARQRAGRVAERRVRRPHAAPAHRAQVRRACRHRPRPRRARELPAHGTLDPRQPGPGRHRVPAVHPRTSSRKTGWCGADWRSAGGASIRARSTARSSTSTRSRTTSCRPRPRGRSAGLVSSSDYTPFEFDGGHIGIYVSRSAQELLPRTIAQWLRSR